MDVLKTIGLTKSLQKKICGMFVNDFVPVFLIGQLGRCDTINNNHFNGSLLLELCFEIISKANNIVGGRCILVECNNIDKLITYYEKNQFRQIKTDETNLDLLQMIRFI